MNSTFCGVNADEMSMTSLPSASISFRVRVLIVKTEPVSTE